MEIIKAMYHSSYLSPIGKLIITASDTAIIRVALCKNESIPVVESDNDVIRQAKVWLDIYFSGKEPLFLPKLELNGTDFQVRVWNELLSIPYGKTCCYGDIAKKIFGSKRGCQSIGQAVGKNPILILIPCHRVIGANGALTGFAEGLEVKKVLLQIEETTVN